MLLDLSIIGGGIAGISSAIYAKRAGLNFLLFEEKAIGGQLLFIERIDNYTGLELNTKGKDLVDRLIKTLNYLNINPVQERVIKIEKEETFIKIFTIKSSYMSKTVIIATGASPKKLGIKEEEKFIGRGISYCAVCDGFFFRGKNVAVVGGGNTAVEEAIYLSGLCNRVFLIHRRENLRAIDCLREELVKKQNIEIKYNSIVKEIKGDDFLREIVLENIKENRTYSLCVDGLFIAVGITPNTSIFGDVVSLDKDGFIITDEEMKTSSNFIWSVGDCRLKPLRQLITAASDGAIAVMSVYRHIKGYISV